MASIHEYDFEAMETVDDSIITSFLDEPTLDDRIDEYEEQLNRVMRSLEAEINTNSLKVVRSTCFPPHQDSPNVEEQQIYESPCVKHVEGCEFPEPQDLDDFGLVGFDDMLLTSSQSDDVMSWYTLSCTDGVDDVDGVGGFDGYSHMNYDVALDQEQQFCYALWQENNDLVV